MDKKSFVKNIFVYILIAVISFFFLFIWNPFQLAIYSLLIGSVLYIAMSIRKYEWRQLNRSNLERYLVNVGIVYLFVVVLYSLSPYLRLKEFQLVHPHYHVVEGDATASRYGIYRQKGNLYSFVDVDYSYQINGIRYQQQQKEALKFYSFPIFSNTKADYLKDRVGRLFNEIQQQQSYVILVNNERPADSRFFSGREVFYWSGSMLKNFLAGILFMITIVGLVGLMAFLFRNYKRPSPDVSKSVVKLIWKVLLGIFVLLFIIYLLLVIYFKSMGKI